MRLAVAELLTKAAGCVLQSYKNLATENSGVRTINLNSWSSNSDFVGKFWPNGEFGLGFQKRVNMSQRIREERSYFDNPENPEVRAWACRMALAQRWCNETGEAIAPLGLSPHVKSHTKAKRGSRGISSFGRKMVRNGAYLLQRKYGKQNLSFLTLTLPSVTVEESERIGKFWSEIVRKFLQSLRRLLQRRSMPEAIVACTEIQESRLESSGVLGLHLHLIFVGRLAKSAWAISYKDARRLWKRELERVIGRELDCSSVENLERVKHDAEQYLGKYMSKGVGVVQRLIEMGFANSLPSSWWSMSQELKCAVKGGVEHLTGERATLFVRLVETSAEVFVYAKPVEVVLTDGQKLKVGYHGKVLREFIHMLYGWKA